MTFKESPYYYPEKCGLSIFENIDTAGSYEFDIFCVWKKEDDGTLWYDIDSGCSCPLPFDIDRHDLQALTNKTFFNFDMALANHCNISKGDYTRIRNLVKEYLANRE